MKGTRHYRIVVLGLLVLLIAAACRPTQQPTRPPATATPSGPPTPIPAGADGNPLRVLLRPPSPLSDTDAQTFATQIDDAVNQKTGLFIQIVPIKSYGEALGALCDNSSALSMAWLDGVTYIAAVAQKCGLPALQVKRDTKREVETGASGQIILSKKLGNNVDVRAIKGRAFCRLNVDDFYTWLLPALVMKANNIDPFHDLKSVTDYPDVPALVKAVANADCDAAGVSEDMLSQYADQIAGDKDNIRVVLTTPPFPYGILTYPFDLQLGVRLALNQAFLDIANDADTGAALKALLGQDSLVPVNPADYDELTAFLNSTGYNFVQLGQ